MEAKNNRSSQRGISIIYVLVFCMAFGCVGKVSAMQIKVDFGDAVHQADVIFAGTVVDKTCRFNSKGNLILTDVRFGEIEVIDVKSTVAGEIENEIVLTYAGGLIGNLQLRVSDMPDLTIGDRYIIFSSYDGKSYSNPLIGGDQGLYRVIKDSQTGREYPLTANRGGIVSVNNGRLKLAGSIKRVSGGLPEQAMAAVAMAAAPRSPKSASKPAKSRQHTPPSSIMSIDEFIFEIHKALSKPAKKKPVKKPSGGSGQQGKTYGNSIESQNKKVSSVPEFASTGVPEESALDRLLKKVNKQAAAGEAPALQTFAGDTLCWCGAYDLPLVMEQVSTGWWTYWHNNDAMVTYNLFMNIYEYVDDDGGFGDNWENEFCGFITNSQKKNAYGTGWGDNKIASCMTWMWWGDCGEIVETDVMFKAGLDWKGNFEDTYDVEGTYLYRPVLMHELGHSWGLMIHKCDETYNYNTLSVMHSYYRDIVEDGWGIHWADAYAIRDIYNDQRSVKNITDIGVESYYADGRLKNATSDFTSYSTGDSITVSNVTIENMSNADVSSLRVRLYLSEDKDITTSDHLLGTPSSNVWEWETFSVDAWWTGDFTTTIPEVIPTGTKGS